MKPPRRPVSGTVVPRAPSRTQRLLAGLIAGLGRVLEATVRLRICDPNRAMDVIASGPVVFAIWHNRLALSMALYRKLLGKRNPSRRMAALVSASRDGAMLAAILESYGVRPVRGSSSRRGSQALLELASRAQEGFDLAITPDGPRGPCYQAQPGIVGLARATGRTIVPVTWNTRWCFRLRSWDRFIVPLPFALCEVRFGTPVVVERDADDARLEQCRSDVESALRGMTSDS